MWTGELRAQVVVIAHTSVSQDEINRTQLLDFYTGDIQAWSNGERVVVFDLKVKGKSADGSIYLSFELRLLVC